MWLVELPYSTDQEVALDLVLRAEFGVFASTSSRDFRPPFPLRLIPSSLFDGSIETNVLKQLVLLSDPNKVAEYLFL